MPPPAREVRKRTASPSASRLSSGSPIPMKTRLVTRAPRQLAARGLPLVDDLRPVQAAGQAELARAAEDAAEGAAGLGRKALGQTLPVGHQHRLARGAVGKRSSSLIVPSAPARRSATSGVTMVQLSASAWRASSAASSVPDRQDPLGVRNRRTSSACHAGWPMPARRETSSSRVSCLRSITPPPPSPPDAPS